MTFNDASRGRAHTWIRNHIVGLLALCVALSGTAVAADGGKGEDNASTAAVTGAKFKKLKKRVAALEAKPNPVVPATVVPATLPPSGPAGGDLTGTYPNPNIAANAVTAAEVADGSLTGGDILDGSIGGVDVTDNVLGRADIAPGGVGPSEIGDNIVVRTGEITVPGGIAENGSYATRETTAFCIGQEEVISGGALWTTGQGNDRELFISELQVATVVEAVVGRGGNDSGVDATLQVQAYCLV